MSYANAITEQFALDPISNLLDDVYFDNYFEKGDDFMASFLAEASTNPVTKKNVFSKLWALIKRFWQWLVKQWNRFTSFIKRLFSRKSKSADQILEEVIPDAVASASKSKPKSEGKDKPKSIKLEFNPEVTDNTVPPSANTIELAYKDLICKIENDQIVFYPNRISPEAHAQNPNYRNNPDIKDYVPAHGEPVAAWDGALMIYFLIDHPDYMSQFTNIIKQLDAKSWEQGLFNATTFSNDVQKFTTALFGRISVHNSFGLTMNQINQFNETLNAFNQSFTFYDDPESIPGGNNPLVLKALNKLAELAYHLQFGITLITGSMTKMHEIDAKYVGIINDNETLSKFIEGCIKGNVPSKYVAFNAFAVCSSDMRGDANQMRPKMGQSRLALFPTGKDVVTKIAINQYGVRANNAELMVYNTLKKHNREDIIARVEEATTNKCVISMEKADTNFDKNSFEVNAAINKLRQDLNQVVHDTGLSVNISDIHSGNVGKRGDKWISIDYGFTER